MFSLLRNLSAEIKLDYFISAGIYVFTFFSDVHVAQYCHVLLIITQLTVNEEYDELKGSQSDGLEFLTIYM